MNISNCGLKSCALNWKFLGKETDSLTINISMELKATPIKSVFNYHGHHHCFVVLLESLLLSVCFSHFFLRTFCPQTHLCLPLSKRICEIFFSVIFVVSIDLVWKGAAIHCIHSVLVCVLCVLFHKFCFLCLVIFVQVGKKEEETDRTDGRLHRRDDSLNNMISIFSSRSNIRFYLLLYHRYFSRKHTHMF